MTFINSSIYCCGTSFRTKILGIDPEKAANTLIAKRRMQDSSVQFYINKIKIPWSPPNNASLILKLSSEGKHLTLKEWKNAIEKALAENI